MTSRISMNYWFLSHSFSIIHLPYMEVDRALFPKLIPTPDHKRFLEASDVTLKDHLSLIDLITNGHSCRNILQQEASITTTINAFLMLKSWTRQRSSIALLTLCDTNLVVKELACFLYHLLWLTQQYCCNLHWHSFSRSIFTSFSLLFSFPSLPNCSIRLFDFSYRRLTRRSGWFFARSRQEQATRTTLRRLHKELH